jgi:hypothetical protein
MESDSPDPRESKGFVSGCPVRQDVLKVGEVTPPPEPDGACAGHLRVFHRSSVAASPLRKAYAGAGQEARVEPFFPEIVGEWARNHFVEEYLAWARA